MLDAVEVHFRNGPFLTRRVVVRPGTQMYRAMLAPQIKFMANTDLDTPLHLTDHTVTYWLEPIESCERHVNGWLGKDDEKKYQEWRKTQRRR